jgi:hypothetical protein
MNALELLRHIAFHSSEKDEVYLSIPQDGKKVLMPITYNDLYFINDDEALGEINERLSKEVS